MTTESNESEGASLDLPEAVRQRIKLKEGEELMWVGQPNRTSLFWLENWPFIGFNVLWTLISGWLLVWAISSANLLITLFAVIAALVAVLIWWLLWLRYRQARQVFYILTNKRAIRYESGRLVLTRSLGYLRPRDIKLVQRPNGYGDVIFAKRSKTDTDGSVSVSELGFRCFGEAVQVAHMLQQLTGEARAQAATVRRQRSAKSKADGWPES